MYMYCICIFLRRLWRSRAAGGGRAPPRLLYVVVLIYRFSCVCIYIYIYIYTHIHTYLYYDYVYVFIYIHAYIYIYIYIHAYIYIYMLFRGAPQRCTAQRGSRRSARRRTRAAAPGAWVYHKYKWEYVS